MRSKAKGEFKVSDYQVTADGVHVWQFDPDFPLEVVYHSLSGLEPFRMNRHDYLEIVYVQTGELVWQIQERFLAQKKGDLFVMGGLFYHRVTENSRSRVNAISLFFQPGLIQSSALPSEGAEYLMPFLLQDSTFPHVISAKTKIPSQIVHWIGQINDEMPANSDRARLSVRTYLKMILLILANHFATYKGTIRAYERRQEHLRRLSPLFDFLERHYSEQIVISDAASLVGMSNSHFRRFFKQTTGKSFVTYLNHFRIARAQEVLESSDKTIAEVGLDVGFCDQSYFGLVFRRLTKITPLEYRQRSRTQPMENFDPPIPNVSRAPCGQTNRPKFRADE